MAKIYGIKNCDTIKKTLNWLNQNNIQYSFHDYKKEGVDQTQLEKFIKKFGLGKVINRKGTTWRKLSSEEQSQINNQTSAITLMQENPSLIKRPLVDLGSTQLIGFNEDEYKAAFKVS